jgi:hypothetical protein
MAYDSTTGASYISPQDIEKRMNLGDLRYAPLQVGSQVVRRSVRVFKGVFDFAIQGGAIGTINLYDQALAPVTKPGMNLNVATLSSKYQPLVLPASFIILNVIIDVLTAFSTTGSPTVAFSSGVAANDIKTATATSSLTVGLVAGIPVNTAASAVKVPATQAAPGAIPNVVVAVAALTAGKANVHFDGYLSD